MQPAANIWCASFSATQKSPHRSLSRRKSRNEAWCRRRKPVTSFGASLFVRSRKDWVQRLIMLWLAVVSKKHSPWSTLDEQRLLAYKREDKSWSWIFRKFLNRSPTAVRPRWNMVQARLRIKGCGRSCTFFRQHVRSLPTRQFWG
jgi:hypothetical protein